ncbi:hypothetical protein [Sorangium sp. So ce362]|uniref:hypothetical protein n=1 Tax=Sorangium sp. So ce362 TaxID=3133303 RepID=UPI003F62823C
MRPRVSSAHRRGRAARCRLVAWALALAAAAPAPPAAAEPPAGGAAGASTPPPAAPASPVAPAVAGLRPGATWEETAAVHEARIAALESQARRVHEIGSEDERRAAQRRIELELAAARRDFDDFEERTTEWNSPVMMVSGLVLASLGGAAILGGAVLVFASYDDSSAGRSEASKLAIATAAGGVAGAAIGLPLYVIGKKRVRRDAASSAPVVARLLVGPGAVAASPGAGPLSAGLRVAF